MTLMHLGSLQTRGHQSSLTTNRINSGRRGEALSNKVEKALLRKLVILALTGFAAFDVLRLGHNVKRISGILRTWKTKSSAPPANLNHRICLAINYAAMIYPKRIECLQRSCVTVCLLRSYGAPAEMVIGAQNLPFKAHAWAEVHGQTINERNDVQKTYAVWERF